jgi:hypothetical protein
VGAEKLAVALLDVDSEYCAKPEDFLPQAKKILKRHKLEWPNAIAPRGFNDTARIFNLSGYGNIVVDGKGIVRGVNVHGKWLEQLVEEMIEGKKPDKPKR